MNSTDKKEKQENKCSICNEVVGLTERGVIVRVVNEEKIYTHKKCM